MNEAKTLLIIDGYALIYRSYFAFINRPIRDSEGRNVSAVFGFFRTLFAVLREYRPDYLTVAMDSLTPTFRHDLYPEYKATRDKTPEDLHAQIPLIERALEASGVRFLREDGLEADDLIATLACSGRKAGIDILILSGDKDLMQLIDERVTMLRPGTAGTEKFDRQRVMDHFSILPEQVVDYLALIGDTSDNVPGVRGIGPKSAVKLLQEFGTLDGIYADLSRLPPGTSAKLAENRDNAYLSRRLVTLRQDAGCGDLDPVVFTAATVDWRQAIPVFTEIQSSSLVEAAGGAADEIRAAKMGSNAADSGASAGFAEHEEERGGPIDSGRFPDRGQPELFGDGDLSGADNTAGTDADRAAGTDALRLPTGRGTYRTAASLEELDRILAEAAAAGLAAFDIETTDIDEMYARPVGFSLAWEPGYAWYVPLKAGGENRLPEEAVRGRLRKFLEDPDVRIIGQNYKYDYKVLRRWGIARPTIYFDTMIAAWLLDATTQGYGMDRLAAQYLDYATIRYSDVVPKGALFPDIPLEDAAEYAAEDADITFRLFLVFGRMLRERRLESLFHTLEMPLLTVLAEMELEGMRLLPGQLQEYGQELKGRLEVIRESIYKECGHEFNINSTRQLQEVLFQERGLRPAKKTKTGFSTNVAVLEELARFDVVPGLILAHRSLEKLRSTYVEALPAMVNRETGRLHTTLIQTGTATGRLSSKNPNLQNIPVRSDDGRRIRAAFVPADGAVYLSADYSQIELVLLAHFADDPGLKEAFLSRTDVHRYTGSLIFGVPLEEVSDEQRRIAKTINFGVMYGMSAFRLSQELGISRGDAQSFIDAYFIRYSGVRDFIGGIVAEAEREGRVRTLLGHEREIPEIRSRNRMERAGAERIAVNTPIQGSAADIIKLAMLKLAGAIRERGLGSRMVLQVHDELIFEVPAAEVELMKDLVRSTMEQVVQLQVPLRVSLETGSSWGEMH